MKVKTNFKEMYLVDKFLYNKILNSSQSFNNSSSKFNAITRVPSSNESHDSPSNENTFSMKRDEDFPSPNWMKPMQIDNVEKQIEPKQIDNVEKQEQGNGPPNNVHSKAERTYPNQK